MLTNKEKNRPLDADDNEVLLSGSIEVAMVVLGGDLLHDLEEPIVLQIGRDHGVLQCCPSRTTAAEEIGEQRWPESVAQAQTTEHRRPLLRVGVLAMASQTTALPGSRRRRRVLVGQQYLAGEQSRPATPGHTSYAGSEFDGAPRTILTVHARAGEHAAATPWLLGGPVSHIGEAGTTVADLIRELGAGGTGGGGRKDGGEEVGEEEKGTWPARRGEGRNGGGGFGFGWGEGSRNEGMVSWWLICSGWVKQKTYVGPIFAMGGSPRSLLPPWFSIHFLLFPLIFPDVHLHVFEKFVWRLRV
jgi:hypothetical protein